VTIPFVRRVVDASLSGLLLARVALQPAAAMEVAIPWQAEVAAVAPSGNGWAQAFIQREARPREAEVLKFRAVEWAAEIQPARKAATSWCITCSLAIACGPSPSGFTATASKRCVCSPQASGECSLTEEHLHAME